MRRILLCVWFCFLYSRLVGAVPPKPPEVYAGIEVPGPTAGLTEDICEYLMYAGLPDGTLPGWGASNHATRPDFLARGARIYDRPDFLYVHSRGRQGRPPKELSRGFPDDGYYYMRNSWKSDSNYLGLRCGPFSSHGHNDPLSIIVAAYGRTLLIDPGMHPRVTPDAQKWASTRFHNTITVDDRDSHSASAEAWVTEPGFDFVAGTNSGYEGLDGVQHHRRVWFLKAGGSSRPDVWIVFDDISGHGEHTAALRYRLAPVKIADDPDCGCVWTTEDSGNLYIHVAAQPRARLEMSRGPAVWASVDRRNDRGELMPGELQQVPVATYTAKGNLPLAMTTILSPSRTRDPMSWHEQLLMCEPDHPEIRAMWLERDNDAVLVACHRVSALVEPAEPMRITLPDRRVLEADAAGAAIRWRKTSAGWIPTAFHAVRTGAVVLGGQILHDSRREDSADLVLDPDL